ncbi:MAG: hypothetical protein H7Z74_11200 [Anaerolineae bacterium]|nr:hypothetical protein [Gemmatimonadaceae bacterium]
MNARSRLSLARAVLAGSVIASAVLWGSFAALTIYVTARLASGTAYEPWHNELAVIVLSATAVTLAVLWRGRHAISLSRVALWLEEKLPSLQYALVTAQEPLSSTTASALESRIADTRWGEPLGGATVRAVAPPFVLLAALLSVVLVTGLRDRVPIGSRGIGIGSSRSESGTGSNAPSRIANIRASVLSPYSGERIRTLDDPSTIDALVGSQIVISGAGSPEKLSARVGADERSIVAGDRGWVFSFVMPARASALRLADRDFKRLVVLESRPDSAPQVTLISPARDTVFRVPVGSLQLSADARDDFGLTAAWLEYIISSGEGESFIFRSAVLGRTSIARARSQTFRAIFSVDALSLKPGDIVHLRAVARDNNSVNGPSSGYSETRTLRVGRRGEYDSIAVEGAPPPENKGEVSQRMLIIMTEALQKKRPRLARTTVVSEAGRISQDQGRLRRRVGEIIYARLGGEGSAEHSHEAEEDSEGGPGKPLTPEEMLAAAEGATRRGVGDPIDFHGDETPVVAVNRPLLEAFNAMWEAGRELDIGQPDAALPHMRAALAAIQRARAAERIYLRGRPPTVVIDLAKVRLAARVDSVEALKRTPRPTLPALAASRGDRLSTAVALLSLDADAALDSLMLLRMDAIGDAPAFARELGVAIANIRGGRDATDDVLRARRAASGEPVTRAGLPGWTAPR